MTASTLIHATAVALGNDAVLLRGPSGAGKSDLALRLVALDPGALGRIAANAPSDALRLVADDQVRLRETDGRLSVEPPERIAGLIEIRGLGIMAVPHTPRARLRLVVDLVPLDQVPRMPPENDTAVLLGVTLPRLSLHAFDASAPLKCARALHAAISAAPRS